MANTTIQLKYSVVTSNTPSALANGEIAINGADGKLFYRTPGGTIQSIVTYPGPAGLNKEIQFNDAGTAGANAGLTFDKSSASLNVTNINVTTRITTGSGAGGSIAGANVIYSNTFVANSTTPSTSNTTGAIVVAGGLGVAGNIYASNVNVSSRVDWPAVGYAPPSFTNRSVGTKLTVYPALSGSAVDYAIGINGGVLWSSIPQPNSTYSFKWYGGETEIASLNGDGDLSISGNVSVTGNIVVGSSSFINASDTRIINAADPVDPGDVVNKSYLDSVQQGLLAKPSVRAATTGNLSAIYYNGPADDGTDATLTADTNRVFTTLDGVTGWAITSPPMGVLIKNQTNPAHNGRYNLTSLGVVGVSPWVLTRCALCDEADEISGSYSFVQNGTVNKGTGWVQTVEDPTTFVMGTDDIIVSQFSGAGTYTAGDGLALDVTEFSISTDFQALVNSAISSANTANTNATAAYSLAQTAIDTATAMAIALG